MLLTRERSHGDYLSFWYELLVWFHVGKMQKSWSMVAGGADQIPVEMKKSRPKISVELMKIGQT